MKGEIVQSFNFSETKGYPDDRLEHYQTWCVTIGDTKYHVRSELTGTSRSPMRRITTFPCNGTCSRVVEIPEEVRKEVCAILGVEVE